MDFGVETNLEDCAIYFDLPYLLNNGVGREEKQLKLEGDKKGSQLSLRGEDLSTNVWASASELSGAAAVPGYYLGIKRPQRTTMAYSGSLSEV